MTAPIRVAVVRPDPSTTTRWTKALTTLGTPFLNAWVLMLIIGGVTTWHPGYWTTFLVMVAVQTLWWRPRPSPDAWTWPGKKGQR